MIRVYRRLTQLTQSANVAVLVMAKTNHQFFSSIVAKLKIGNRTLDALTNQPSARHTIDAENCSYSISMEHLIIHYGRASVKKETERVSPAMVERRKPSRVGLQIQTWTRRPIRRNSRVLSFEYKTNTSS